MLSLLKFPSNFMNRFQFVLVKMQTRCICAWLRIDISLIAIVAKSCPTLRDPMDYSTPGFPVLHYLAEFAQTHAHQTGDAIQPSHPLMTLYPLTLSLS